MYDFSVNSPEGFDLIDETIDSIMSWTHSGFFLGNGDKYYEQKLKKWAERWPEKIAISITYSSEQAHQLFAGSDLFLMPSIFEPCGQSQIYSMRYGTIPLAHAVGGLVDTIQPYPKRGSTGFLFKPFTADAFVSAVQYALKRTINHDAGSLNEARYAS